MNTKVLVLDIDGTLTNSEKQITPNTKQAIIDTMKRGHLVILASGRPTTGMKRYAEELMLEEYGGYMLSFNGARIIQCKTGEIIYQQTLPTNVISGLYHFALENDLGICTYLGDDIIVGTRIDPYLELESRINQMKMKQVEHFDKFVDFDVNKCLITVHPQKAPELLTVLQKKYGDILSIYRSEPFFIEVMPQHVDKAASLEKMLSSVGLAREDVICCGDGYNDISMIKYAGIGVAMENAQKSVKEVADFITDSNNSDGIVKVVNKFIHL